MNEKIAKIRQKMTLNPIMTFLILILLTLVLSGFLSLINFESSYKVINENTGEYKNILVSVKSLFNLSGLKYIFSHTVSNFVSFVPLSSIIIILIGIGVMESSGFLKTAFTLLTKYTKKNTMTFIIAIIGVFASIGGDIGYVVLIPLSALLFKYGRRNPLLGIITAFAGLACGSGINMFLTSIDSSMLAQTTLASHILDANYEIKTTAFIFIMGAAAIILAFVITYITEKITSSRINKYSFKEEEEIEITRKDLKGLIIALIAGLIYLFIFIYNIIPGLPLSGNFLDNSQINYIDKLFSYDSFFSNGFIFIITLLFVVMGLFYGIGAKTIKNNHDFCKCLSHSLDKIGKTLVLIFFASIFISVFKATNIGTVIIAMFSNTISKTSFTGIPLIVLLFAIGSISALVLPLPLSKWTILSGVTVPVVMNAGLSPAFTQVIFRFSESYVMGLTPLMAYFVIYLAFIENYNQSERPVSLFKSLKYMVPYSLMIGLILLVLIIGWYLIGLPIGIGSFTVI